MPSKPVDPLTLLLEGIADYSIFLLDPQGKVTHWPSAARKMFGYAENEIIGRHFSCLYQAEENDSALTNAELDMAAAHGRFEDIGWRVRQDQSTFWADSVICPLREAGGPIESFSVIIRDITERKKADEALRQKEEELTQARKMEAVGRLAGGVAHDFNNFITGISGLAEDIRQSMSELDPRRADLDEIIKTADRARALTRELLAFGRRQTLAPQVVQMNTVLKEKQKMLARMLGADIQLQLELDPSAGRILLDPTQVDQMLINLLMNARDAMSQGGIIRIETRRTIHSATAHLASSPQVTLIVSDTGHGMDEKVLTHLFEPFFTTKDKGKGTGLGLATVYGIVTQNHGTIEVQSKPGLGTTFIIEFPEIDSPFQAVSMTPAPSAMPGSATILVVEDTDVVRRVVSQVLSKAGYNVLTAASGIEAIELLRNHSGEIELMLTDLIMPGLNGRQLAERVQASHPEATIMFMSAYAEDLVQERGFMPEEGLFIQKPFTNDSLLHRISETLKARHLAGTAKNA
jgi:two-component system cell cycle sensor histidine kinase/response regulator CckA